MLHRWFIEPGEYRRHEQRRGRRHAFTSVEPSTTALVVVDMVPFFVADNPYALGIVRNVRRTADVVRATGGVVAWLVPSNEPPSPARSEFLGERIAELYRTSGGSGPLADRLWSGLAVSEADLVVEKRTAGALAAGSDLAELLGDRNVETVLVAGTVANVCCESTVREASSLGYRTLMIADANAARNDADLNATLRTVYRSFGDVRTVDEIVVLLDQSSSQGPTSR